MPIPTTRVLTELIELISPSKRVRLIGIDGLDGSGKTYLAQQLAPHMCAKHINPDDFLNLNEDGFLDHLRYKELELAAGTALKDGYVIIEGVCLRAVLDRLRHRADVHIYVKRVTADGFWPRGEFLYLAESADEALASKRESAKRLAEFCGDPPEPGQPLISGLYRDLVTYHFQFRPHECADFIFERE